MKVLVFLFFALCLAFSEGAQLNVANGPNLFTINLAPSGAVSFTKNGKFYPTLSGLTSCPNGATPVSKGNGDWQCTPIDTLQNLAPTCPQNTSTDPLAKVVGGTFQCVPDNDALLALESVCLTGQTVKSTGSGWTCGYDTDNAANLTSCSSGQTYQWNGAAFVCAPTSAVSDSDILGKLTTCSFGQVAKFNGTGWACSQDADSLPTGCANNSILIYRTTPTPGWTCSTDSDVLLTGIVTGCNSTTTFPKYRSGAWACQNLYWVFVAKKRNIQEIEQNAAQLLLISTSTSYSVFTDISSTFTVTWGTLGQSTKKSVAGLSLPVSGTIQAARFLFQQTTFTGGSFKLNISTTTSSYAQTFSVPASTTGGSFSSSKFALPFVPNQVINAVITPSYSGSIPVGQLGYYTLELYAAV